MVSLRSHLAALLVTLAAALDLGASTNLTEWLAGQSKIQTWSADFLQTRTLKALVQPLTNRGHIWFAAPNRFRWELGEPAQTVAVRNTNELLLVYPRLKRAERYPLSEQSQGRWRDMLALLEAGFPRSQAELESRFRIVSITETNGQGRLVLQPRSSQARRWMREIEVVFDQRNFALAATELRFADGSTLRNEFIDPKLNVAVDERLFSPAVPPEFKVVQPLSR